MEIRTPVIAILVLSILIIVYLRKNMPQVFSSRVFFCFLIADFINVACEILECIVFEYADRSYLGLRRFSQILYIASLLLCAYMISLYVYAKATRGKAVSRRAIILFAIPGIFGTASLFFDRIYYSRTLSGDYYNYGPLVQLCYAIGFLYIFSSLVMAIRHRDRMRKDEPKVIIAGLIMCAILFGAQFTFHGFQVSSVAIMLMALILFLASENPKEYYERDLTNVKNRIAFLMMLEERFGQKKQFFIASVIFTGRTNVLTGEDRQMLLGLQEKIAKKAEEEIGSSIFLSEWNTISCVVKSPKKVERLMEIVNNFKDDSGNYRLTFLVMELPKCAETVDKTLLVLNYVTGEYIYTQSSPNVVVDQRIVDKMVYRNSVEDIVRQAVKDKSFDVYYQPILCVTDGKFTSAEALVRLRRPDNESYISPEDFVPVAEQCGLIQEIDDLVFEKVCSFIARENLSSYGLKTVEVNLSRNEAVDRQTHERLLSKMEKYHIPPKFINFEITETAYINNDDTFKENVQSLKDMGSTFSMDDFGSGYSNLLELLKMDYKLVKMDKEFIWKCLDKDKPENMRMLEYSISFLKDYGLHVLAEGVETIDQAEILIEKGVEYLQGFYYSRPIPEGEYIEFLKAQKGDRL